LTNDDELTVSATVRLEDVLRTLCAMPPVRLANMLTDDQAGHLASMLSTRKRTSKDSSAP